MNDSMSGRSFTQQIILQIAVAAIAGFLGTYVGVEVVKERIVNLSDRVARVELDIAKLRDAQSTILQAQVQSLGQLLEAEKKRPR